MDKIKLFLASRRATTFLYIAFFFSFSWLSYGAYIRFDLSSTGAMRISDTSKNLLRSLPEKGTMELFVSNDLPDEAVLVARKVRDFIQEYANSSKGHMKLTILDPDNDKSAAERARSLGIQQLDLAVQGSKKAQAQSIYFGLAMSYGAKSDTLNNLIGLYEQQDLENQLTAKLFKMVKPNERKIAILSGHGPFTLKAERSPTSLSVFAEKIETFYGSIMEVNTTTTDIPAEVSTLLIVQPGKLDPIDKFRIDQFLMRGGNLIVAASGMDVSFGQQFMAGQAPSDLTDFLKGYGIELAQDMVQEPKSTHFIPFIQPVNGMQMMKFPYPPWVLVTKDGLDQKNLATKGNAALTMPFTSSLKTNPMLLPVGEGQGKFTVDVLAKSTSDAWSQANFAFLDPSKMEDAMAAPKQNAGVYNLALFIQGKFTSQYANQPPPKNAPKTWSKNAEKASSILVLGSPYAFSNLTAILNQMTGLPLLEENNKMIFATIDIMNGNQELVALRKKAKPRIKAKLVEESSRKIFTTLAFLLPLLGISAAGFLRIYRRNQKNRLNVSGESNAEGSN